MGNPDLTLADIPKGGKASVVSFGDIPLSLKLMEMGCIPGETITVDQYAPMGDPISITVAGYRLSLRLNEAEMIWVEEIAVSNL